MLEVLVVDDEPAVRMSVAQALAEAGHRVTEARDGAEALEQILARVFDVALFDVRLPGIDGLTLFRRLHLESPGTVVILMTAYARVRDAVETIRGGAHDYVLKPFDPSDLVARVIGPIAERRALQAEFVRARARLVEREIGTDFVGCSPFAAKVRSDIEAAAQSTAPLLIYGEPGSGKRLVARLVHVQSPRRDRPYVLVSCASLPSDGAAALFGPAISPGTDPPRTEGCFESARHGTMTLDEVGDLSPNCQALIAASLGEAMAGAQTSYPPMSADVRIVATSREDLDVRAPNSFREELLSKLRVLTIRLQPLREHRADLPLLFESIIARAARGVPPKIAPRAWELFQAYPFPGNVAELHAAIHHSLTLARGAVIDVEHLPPIMTTAGARRSGRPPPTQSGTHRITVHATAEAPKRRRRQT